MYLQFPWKLHEMLRGVEVSHPSIVSWNHHGKSFRVHNTEEFVKQVLPLYFKQSHYKSFQRQLNLWGFERVARGPEVGSYYHEFFVKGQPNLCGYMTRQKIKGTGGVNNRGLSAEGTKPPGTTGKAVPSAADAASTTGGSNLAASIGRRRSLPTSLMKAPSGSKKPDASSRASFSTPQPATTSGQAPATEKEMFNPLSALAELALLGDKPHCNTNPVSLEDPAQEASPERELLEKANVEPNAAESREPRRPLSAYNIFFELQRKRILGGMSSMGEPASDQFIQSIESTLLETSGSNGTSKSEDEESDISRLIAEMWKTLDPVSRAILDCYALQEMRRYETEVKLWRERKETASSSNPAPTSKSPSLSSSSARGETGDVIRALRAGQGETRKYGATPMPPMFSFRGAAMTQAGRDTTGFASRRFSAPIPQPTFSTGSRSNTDAIMESIVARAKLALAPANAAMFASDLKSPSMNPGRDAESSLAALSAKSNRRMPSLNSKKLPFKKRRSLALEEDSEDMDISSKIAKVPPQLDARGEEIVNEPVVHQDEAAAETDCHPTKSINLEEKSGLVKRGGWKKPRGKPKRPLSAYNMYFTFTRNRIVSGEMEEPSVKELEDGIQDILENPKAKRAHRKTCTGVSFQDLARRIAGKWKTIAPDHKTILDRFAAEEMNRYKEAVADWKSREGGLEDNAMDSSNHSDKLVDDEESLEEPVETAAETPQEVRTPFNHSAAEQDFAMFLAQARAQQRLSFAQTQERPILDFLAGQRASQIQRAANQTNGSMEGPILDFLRGGNVADASLNFLSAKNPLEQSRFAFRNSFLKTALPYSGPGAGMVPSLVGGLLQRSIREPQATVTNSVMSQFLESSPDQLTVQQDERNDPKPTISSPQGNATLDVAPTNEPSPPSFTLKNEKQAMPFPYALYNMLHTAEEEGKSSVVSWLSHGKAFRVNNKELFVNTMMSTFFKQTKFKSFQRQLNLWGFTRITEGPDSGSYYHRNFVRGDPALCKLMTRQKVKGTGNQASAQGSRAGPQVAEVSETSISKMSGKAECFLSTLASCASDKLALHSHLGVRSRLKLPSVTPISPEIESASDTGNRGPTAQASKQQSRERTILMSNLALEVVGE